VREIERAIHAARHEKELAALDDARENERDREWERKSERVREIERAIHAVRHEEELAALDDARENESERVRERERYTPSGTRRSWRRWTTPSTTCATPVRRLTAALQPFYSALQPFYSALQPFYSALQPFYRVAARHNAGAPLYRLLENF
jgi:hypothetical protein